MVRSILTFLALILIFAAVIALPAAQQSRKFEPLTEGEIIRLLEGGVPSERVGGLVRERGITFEVTAAVERDLMDAGANDQLLRTLRELTPATRKAEPKTETRKTEAPPAKGTLLIAVDAPCKVTLDGDEVGEMTPDVPKRIPVALGEHLVKAASKELPTAQAEWTGKVEKAEQVVVQLRVAEKVASVKKAREEAERASAEKERSESLQPYLKILGRWTSHHESKPGPSPCRFMTTATRVLEFRAEGLQGGSLRGKGTGSARIAPQGRGALGCRKPLMDMELSYDLLVTYQPGEGVYKYRQTVTGCSGTCKSVTYESSEGTFRLESPDALVIGGDRFQKSAE